MTIHMFYRYLILISITIVSNMTLVAQESVSKTVEKNFSIQADGALNINNKYGNVTLNGWDKNELGITMNAKVFGKEESEAVSLLERIQPEIKIVGDLIFVSSKILEKKGNSISRYFSKANPLKFDKNNVQIDFTINLPKTISVDVTNKFGDIFIDAFDGDLKVDLQHGDLWINNDLNQTTIALKFGKVKAKNINNASIELKNATLDIKSSENIDLNSSGSTLEFSQITKLNLISNKDKIKIDQVDKVEGEIKFSEIHINSLLELLDVSMKITDLSIDQIKNPKAQISIDQESSDIDINITQTSFQFKAHLTEGILKIPKTFRDISSKIIDKNKKIRDITAIYGKTPDGKMYINGFRGNIILKDSSLSQNN